MTLSEDKKLADINVGRVKIEVRFECALNLLTDFFLGRPRAFRGGNLSFFTAVFGLVGGYNSVPK